MKYSSLLAPTIAALALAACNRPEVVTPPDPIVVTVPAPAPAVAPVAAPIIVQVPVPGPPGPAGVQGDPGPQGATGVQGAPGINGASAPSTPGVINDRDDTTDRR
jgi:hypothetical protein